MFSRNTYFEERERPGHREREREKGQDRDKERERERSERQSNRDKDRERKEIGKKKWTSTNSPPKFNSEKYDSFKLKTGLNIKS